MPGKPVVLCGHDGCRLRVGHDGDHDAQPASAWAFMQDRDRRKLAKAGYATPRGGHKGAYQNHVYRNNKVIVPFERIQNCDLEVFADGYTVRLYPDQYFSAPGVARNEFLDPGAPVRVGENAFVLYRSHASLEAFPPPPEWDVRGLEKDGEARTRRGADVDDTGHFVLRLPTLGGQPARDEGPPQGIFAPEYSPADDNYLCQCVLAWLIVHTVGSPFTTAQAEHLRAILDAADLADDALWERQGILRHGLTSCPLCSRLIKYEELHTMLVLDEEEALANAAVQVEGATRSTIVNLFHMEPLRYGVLNHQPQTVAWGHATCNTKLGQRRCYSLDEIMDQGRKVGIVLEEGIETFGWISQDWEMIRSPEGSVWIRLCGDGAEDAPETATAENDGDGMAGGVP